MNLLFEGFAWIFDPAHHGGDEGIGTRILQHLGITLVVMVIASLIAIPLGYLIGHTGRGRSVVVALSGGVRALPTLGVISLIALSVGIGFTAPVIALVILAIPSILAGAYSGFEAVDRRTIDAARAVGMTEGQIVTRVEVPLGLPLLIGGLRSATLQVIATATLADYVGAGGLGRYIFSGQATNDYPQMLAGSILVIMLALVSEALFSLLQRSLVPAGVVAAEQRQPDGETSGGPTRKSGPRRSLIAGARR
ncbi:osmoprotectant transport system permease protein [Glaciihabitans tibetensis]|uniref:Osmoprotectant transport system permease protein n=1 Tax=Glaciihabitans tibetensis TaxID=1266600 RepID=A0A2T0VIY8_9MICO|nr:ABC transporter permease [Glaciihabitans tibetensis]PRY70184.1 osmoprotectant transport system permease protein [Glaciihabitans tibetensis]